LFLFSKAFLTCRKQYPALPRVRLGRPRSQTGAGPRAVCPEAADNMNMQLGNEIAQGSCVELVRGIKKLDYFRDSGYFSIKTVLSAAPSRESPERSLFQGRV